MGCTYIDHWLLHYFLPPIFGMKILNVTADLLVSIVIYKLNSSVPMVRLYYSSSVSYFGKDHRPYAILAVVMFFLFTIIPALTLFLYSFQCSHKMLSLFPFNWHYLHAFVDSFQGCYKDGTEPGTFDCRWFAVVLLLLRPLFFIITCINPHTAFIHKLFQWIVAIFKD